MVPNSSTVTAAGQGHTPGPWSFHDFGNPEIRKVSEDAEWSYADYYIGRDDKIIAKVEFQAGHAGGYEQVDDEKEFAANAHLIATAPELLAALEDAAQTFRRYQDMHAAKGTSEGDMKAFANGEKARRYEVLIAQARGEAL